MLPNPQFLAKLVTFTEQIFNRKLHFLCNEVLFHHSCLWQDFTGANLDLRGNDQKPFCLIKIISKAHSKPYQTSKMERFTKIFNSFIKIVEGF